MSPPTGQPVSFGRAAEPAAWYSPNMAGIGRILLILGVVLLVVGGALILAEKLGVGRLPGDIVVERKNFRLYVPIATSIVLSLVLTAVLNLVFRK